MRRAARVDANQAEIVSALRKAGATVELLHAVGGGCPDILAGYLGRNLLMEIKGPGGRLNEIEHEWHLWWRGQVVVVYTAEEALRIIGALR